MQLPARDGWLYVLAQRPGPVADGADLPERASAGAEEILVRGRRTPGTDSCRDPNKLGGDNQTPLSSGIQGKFCES